jgi:hypothetical protein
MIFDHWTLAFLAAILLGGVVWMLGFAAFGTFFIGCGVGAAFFRGLEAW